jgi:hypothetical protein
MEGQGMTPNAYQLHCPSCDISRTARFDEQLPKVCGKCGSSITHTNIATPRELQKVTPFDAWRAKAQQIDTAMSIHHKHFADDAKAYYQSCMEYELELQKRFPMPKYSRNSRTIPATFPAWNHRGKGRYFPQDRR